MSKLPSVYPNAHRAVTPHPHIATTSFGACHVWGRMRLDDDQVPPPTVDAVAFTWNQDGDIWAFHAVLTHVQANATMLVFETIYRAAGACACAIDLVQWEPEARCEERILSTGATLVYREDQPVELRHDDEIDEQTIIALRAALGCCVEVGPQRVVEESSHRFRLTEYRAQVAVLA